MAPGFNQEIYDNLKEKAAVTRPYWVDQIRPHYDKSKKTKEARKQLQKSRQWMADQIEKNIAKKEANTTGFAKHANQDLCSSASSATSTCTTTTTCTSTLTKESRAFRNHESSLDTSEHAPSFWDIASGGPNIKIGGTDRKYKPAYLHEMNEYKLGQGHCPSTPTELDRMMNSELSPSERPSEPETCISKTTHPLGSHDAFASMCSATDDPDLAKSRRKSQSKLSKDCDDDSDEEDDGNDGGDKCSSVTESEKHNPINDLCVRKSAGRKPKALGQLKDTKSCGRTTISLDSSFIESITKDVVKLVKQALDDAKFDAHKSRSGCRSVKGSSSCSSKQTSSTCSSKQTSSSKKSAPSSTSKSCSSNRRYRQR